MNRSFVLTTTLTLVLIGMLHMAFEVHRVEASGTIYIRVTGEVEGTDEIQRDGDVYTFKGNVHGCVVIEKNNIVIDGTGYTLQGTGSGKGIKLDDRSNVTIKNMEINTFHEGIYLWGSNNTISANSITNNKEGILMPRSYNNIISGNNITANDYYGIFVYQGSSNNIISQNNFENNYYGIFLESSANNSIYHNNFMDNYEHVKIFESTNVWDDGYPSGGNYWSNYTEVDKYHGSNQDALGSDGIEDTPYKIGENNTDNYPLMGMFSSFSTSLGHCVNVISNSTIEDFQYFEFERTIKMYVSSRAANLAFGFCRVCVPHTLMNPTEISVIIDDGLTPVLHHNYTLHDNGTHRWIYFAYKHPIREIDIISEFSSFLILPLFMMAMLPTVIVYKRKHTM